MKIKLIGSDSAQIFRRNFFSSVFDETRQRICAPHLVLLRQQRTEY